MHWNQLKLKKIITLRLPVICVLCNHYHQEPTPVCQDCMHLFIPIDVGSQCLSNPTEYIDFILTAYLFAEPLRKLLHEFKYNQGIYLTKFLVNLMLKAPYQLIKNSNCLMPVPLHNLRLKQRGFNQAMLLATKLSKITKIPIDIKSCHKIKHTAEQALLDGKDRKNNIRDAFNINPKIDKINYKHIILIDDLVTTGSTVNEIAKMLKIHGVERVDVWCCARVISS